MRFQHLLKHGRFNRILNEGAASGALYDSEPFVNSCGSFSGRFLWFFLYLLIIPRTCYVVVLTGLARNQYIVLNSPHVCRHTARFRPDEGRKMHHSIRQV